MNADRCLAGGGWTEYHRLTLSRAKTGDLIFCGWQCMERWRMNRIERFQMEEMFVQLAADAIVAGHPKADWLAKHAYAGRVPLSDDDLTRGAERLADWLARQTTPTTGTG